MFGAIKYIPSNQSQTQPRPSVREGLRPRGQASSLEVRLETGRTDSCNIGVLPRASSDTWKLRGEPDAWGSRGSLSVLRLSVLRVKPKHRSQLPHPSKAPVSWRAVSCLISSEACPDGSARPSVSLLNYVQKEG